MEKKHTCCHFEAKRESLLFSLSKSGARFLTHHKKTVVRFGMTTNNIIALEMCFSKEAEKVTPELVFCDPYIEAVRLARTRLEGKRGLSMARKKKAPELSFQQHIADFLVSKHGYGELEQSDLTDTEHFIAEDHLWAFLTATQAEMLTRLTADYRTDAWDEVFKALRKELVHTPLLDVAEPVVMDAKGFFPWVQDKMLRGASMIFKLRHTVTL
jgi:hypothetical protein